MVAQGSGSIVNMSSGAGLVGVRGFSGYTATKAAEIAMTKSSALDVAPYGIRINAVCPGLVETPMIASLDLNEEPMNSIVASHPLDRIAKASEIADAVVWLCSDKASFVTGVALPADRRAALFRAFLGAVRVLTPQTPFAYSQVLSRTFGSFRVLKFSISAGQRNFEASSIPGSSTEKGRISGPSPSVHRPDIPDMPLGREVIPTRANGQSRASIAPSRRSRSMYASSPTSYVTLTI